VLNVIVDRLASYHQTFRDLLVRESSGQQPQDLDLPGGEPGRPFASASDRMAGRFQYGGDALTVLAARSDLVPQKLGRVDGR
jgi:hypothetical protein